MNRIMTNAEYEAALTRVEALMDAPEGSPEFLELLRLAEQVEAYEEERFPFGSASALASDRADPVATTA